MAASASRCFTPASSGNETGDDATRCSPVRSTVGWIQAAELGSRVSSIASINAPYLASSTGQVAKLVRHPSAMRLLDVLPRETGTIGLGWGITGMRVVFSNKNIAGVKDLNGLKLRINPTPVYRDFYQLLGAAPTPIPTPAVYDAMANGQVDGLEADIEFSWNQRFDRVSKVMLPMNAVFMPFAPLVSGRIWQTLDDKDKDLIRGLTTKVLDEQIKDIVNTELGLIEKLKTAGTVSIKQDSSFNPAEVIKAFDAMWLPKAPQITDLRKVASSL